MATRGAVPEVSGGGLLRDRARSPVGPIPGNRVVPQGTGESRIIGRRSGAFGPAVAVQPGRDLPGVEAQEPAPLHDRDAPLGHQAPDVANTDAEHLSYGLDVEELGQAAHGPAVVPIVGYWSGCHCCCHCWFLLLFTPGYPGHHYWPRRGQNATKMPLM